LDFHLPLVLCFCLLYASSHLAIPLPGRFWYKSSVANDARHILVIDDEEAICFAFARYFERRGFAVSVAATGKEGERQFAEARPDIVFLDVRLPDVNGLDVLERLRQIDARACVVVITAYGTLETVTRAIRQKAFDYLVKPLDLDRAGQIVVEALASRAAADARQGSGTAGQGDKPAGPAAHATKPDGLLVGSSQAMQEVYKHIGKVALVDAAVLILGDTGTGKELVARAIHEHSARCGRPFVPVNCGALPENLVESELFGYVKGAFSGADSDKPGRFEAADGGTLFLDEVADLPLAAQVKLLRFLDSQTVERLGSIRSISLDVRVLAATNRDVRKAIEAGAFREDLFYRLAVVQIELPPLRKRRQDIFELAEHFLAQRSGDRVHLSAAAAVVLYGHRWPGNVRELRNAMEHAAVVCGGDVILPRHLPAAVRAAAGGAGPDASRVHQAAEAYLDSLPPGAGQFGRAVEPLERALIHRALSETHGNQSAAADLLGLHRNTLRNKLRQLGMEGGQEE
jgi:DNA-binding NtrC family response regulator